MFFNNVYFVCSFLLVVGCKRFRDEVVVNFDFFEKVVDVFVIKILEEEYVYGFGMIFIKKSFVYVVDVSS